MFLPELDEDEIDVDGYFSSIHQIIKNHPRFTLRRRVSLCLLSFTNMLLVRDLDPSKWPNILEQNGLLAHKIVRQVLEGDTHEAEHEFTLGEDYPVEDGPGANIPLVYDADSSQHSALVDVIVERKNLVIEGPPGTGKSQTITNLIAANLAEGKRVLFVAEKLAALEVVKNRLTLAGLDPFVLELHSNKTNKKRVLEEIAKRVEFRSKPPTDLPRKLAQHETHRGELRSYADLINSVSHNSFGLTLHQVLWRAERHRLLPSFDERPLTQISIADAEELSEFELTRRMDCLEHLSSQYNDINGFDADSMFWGFYPIQIIPGDEIKLQELFASARGWVDRFVNDAQVYSDLLTGKVVGLNIDIANAQIDALKKLLSSVDELLPLHLLPGFFQGDSTGIRVKELLETFSTQLERFHQLAPKVKDGLRQEASGTQVTLECLKRLDSVARELGITLGTPREVSDVRDLLQHEYNALLATLETIHLFCDRNCIPFDGTRDKLTKIADLTRLILEAPEEFLHLQSPGLTREGCQQAIESLVVLQREWNEIQRELDGELYIDALPTEKELMQAILTMREGNAWYRIFQGRWRSAIAFHTKLQRTKQRITLGQRLGQLEKLLALSQLKVRWKADPSWVKFLGFPAPLEALSLDGYLVLTKWNRSIKLLMEELGTQVFSIADFTPEKARELRRNFATVKTDLSVATASLRSIDALLPKLSQLREGQVLENVLSLVHSFIDTLTDQQIWLQAEVPNQAPFAACILACEAATERREIATSVNGNNEVKSLLGDRFAHVNTDVGAALAALSFGQGIDHLNLAAAIKSKLRSTHPIETAKMIISALEPVQVGFIQVSDFEMQLRSLGEFDLAAWVGLRAEDNLVDFAKGFRDKLHKVIKSCELLIPWSIYVARRGEANALGLREFVNLLETRQVPPAGLAVAYAYCVYTTIVRTAFRYIPQLGKFSGLKHNQIREQFRRLDHEIIQLRGKSIAAMCQQNAHPPTGRNGVRVDDKTEMVLLNYLLPQQRPRMPVRKMLARAGNAVQALKPCFMMGPQAVAQYLTPGAITFDLVIMDEASQLKPEEAIGAIARGGQVVVVGDPKQLPPTSFFSRMNLSADGDEQYTTTDAESILDVCASNFKPIRALRWHYRSQHHSLIAFSNHNFYRNNLIIFPSPYGQSSRLGVRATYLADAIYDNQTNLKEAKRVVDAVVEHIAQRPNESLGVVTLNIKQRDLIAELLDERLRNVRGADTYREHWKNDGQRLFVNNLENVQGDERDAIIISTTFGKPPGSNSVRQNFGPISRQGGWRRLNVLFTRARRSIAIYTSLRPEDIINDRTTPEGTKALRNYLEYARTGFLTVAEDIQREPDSDFEVAVIDLLRSRGYEVTPQLGVAGYRIDIAVKHPDALGSYLAAIECDGASYHSALSVRDRDRIRQEVLEALGWRGRIWRIWSTDWFRAPRQELEKLIGFLENLRTSWKPEHSYGESWVEEGQPPNIEEAESHAIQDEEREIISQVLLESEDDLEVEIGDVVQYADVTNPQNVESVQITRHTSDPKRGLILEATALAQALLGATVGDEVPLQVRGAEPRTLRILAIKRDPAQK